MAAVQAYIHKHLAGDLRIEKLAAVANMSPRNFSRIFQQLEHSQASIAKVAESCGYKSPHSLRTAFERQLGVSPRAYRQRFRSST